MSPPSIVVVGSFVQDLTFRCAAFPRPGETVLGHFATGPGGKGSNQAVAAARAGGRVAFIGAVGDDAFGTGAREFHRAEGIEWWAAVKPGQPTGTAAILVNDQGQNEIIVALDANNALTPADIDAQASRISRDIIVMVTQLEANLDAQSHAMKMAQQHGVHVILNPAPMRADFDAAMLADVDILIPNETEFCALAGLDEGQLSSFADADLHVACRRLGVETVIVTLGDRGCFVSRADDFAAIPAMTGVRAVDTTGAGDAFVGAFAAALMEFGVQEIERAARFANAAAAISVTRPGTAPAMPRRAEIETLLANQPA